MPAINTSSAVHTFLQSADAAAMRTNIGLVMPTNQWTSITFSGAFTFTGVVTGNTSVTFPTSGTLATLAGSETLTNKTLTSAALTTPTVGSAGATFSGSSSGSTVLKASAAASGTITLPAVTDTVVCLAASQTLSNKTLTAPVLGVATCTSINGLGITASGGSITLNSALTMTSGHAITVATTGSTSVTLPTSGTLYGTASGSITSAQLRGSLTDETGTGSAVFATGPTITNAVLVTPDVGAANGTSLTLSSLLDVSGGSTVLGSVLSGDITSQTILVEGVSFGYSTGAGAGGDITQITSATTAVTLNKATGRITTVAQNIAAEASVSFTVNNTAVASTDVIIVNIQSGSNGGNTIAFVKSVGSSSFVIQIANNNAAAGTAETGTLILNFAVIKGANS